MTASIDSAFEPHWVQRPGRRVSRVDAAPNVEHVLQLLRHDPSAQVVAGGTDLVLDLVRGSGPDVRLIDVSSIEGFDAIEIGASEIVLHGGVRHNDVVSDPGLVRHALALTQACLEIGSPQLRNRATLAGNVVTASPANDSISALMALGATIDLMRAVKVPQIEAFDGDAEDDLGFETRNVAIADFFSGFRATVRQPHELITAFRIPRIDSARSVWVKAGLRKAQAISVVHAGLWLDVSEGFVTAARIALGSVAPTVTLSAEAAESLVGQELTAASIEAATEAAVESVSPIDDGRATAAYRRDAVATVVRRGLRALAAGAQRSTWPKRPTTLRTPGRDRTLGRREWWETEEAFYGMMATFGGAGLTDENEVAVYVNGSRESGNRAASLTLLDWLRTHVGKGTKEGCAEGECGACTVMLDGDAVMSCLVPAMQAVGRDVVTVEGLDHATELSVVPQAYVDHFAVQCGYCIPGFVMSTHALREERVGQTAPTRDEIELALSGNLCRCTGYYAILQAVEAAVAVPEGDR